MYFIVELVFTCEERYNIKLHFSQVSFQKNEADLIDVNLINESTPYVWDISQLTYGTVVPKEKVHS